MNKNIVYVAYDHLGTNNQGKEKKFESEYIKKYQQNIIEIDNKDKWKYSGESAMFQGREQMSHNVAVSINGIANCDEKSFFYAATTGDVSGIIRKEYETGEESILSHAYNKIFYSLEYNKQKNQIVSAMSNESISKDIAVFDVARYDLITITSGDSFDENPSFSKFSNEIYFNSRGIARDKDMEMVGLGISGLYAINQDFYSIKDVLEENGYDLLAPKTDEKGNIYYIRKPYRNNISSSNFILDLVLMPFRLVLGFGKVLMFLSKLTVKKDKKKGGMTKGGNPAKFKEEYHNDLNIFEENIDTAKEESKNQKKGIKNAGYAPYNFELWKMDTKGEKTKLKNSVLSYDVDENGNIIYTNGKYIISIDNEGREEVLFKDKIITAVSFQ